MLSIFLLVLSVSRVEVFLSVVGRGDQGIDLGYYTTHRILPCYSRGFCSRTVGSDCNTEPFPRGAIRVSKQYREELMVRIGVF